MSSTTPEEAKSVFIDGECRGGASCREVRNPAMGGVICRDAVEAAQVATSLEVEISGVNEGISSAANLPMGGVDDGGLGREGGHVGVEKFPETQYLAVRVGGFRTIGKETSVWNKEDEAGGICRWRP